MKFLFSLFTVILWFNAQAETKFPEDKLQQVQNILDESKPLEVIHEIEKSPEIEKPSPEKVKYLRDILTRAKIHNRKDAKKLLDQLNFIPYKEDPETGAQIYKVTSVTKSSFFEKAGIRVGDLLISGSSSNRVIIVE